MARLVPLSISSNFDRNCYEQSVRFFLSIKMEQIFDSVGNPLHIGNTVRYSGTGTTGTVTEIIQDEDGIWAVLDKTNLLYSVETLTITGEVKKEKEMEEVQFTREQIAEVLEKQKEQAPDKLDDTSVECGG